MNDEVVRPDAVDESPAGEVISHPTKLIRIASMTRAMLEEVRQAPIDEQGRQRLVAVHGQSVDELRGVLSEDLLEEFNQIMVPLNADGDTASDSEIRIAQAQLIGWLEGLFHGIQASLFSQQVAAQNQLAEMQKRAITAPPTPERDDGNGLYL